MRQYSSDFEESGKKSAERMARMQLSRAFLANGDHLTNSVAYQDQLNRALSVRGDVVEPITFTPRSSPT
jgi:hypothetical protein